MLVLEIYNNENDLIGSIDINDIPILMNYAVKDINNPAVNKQSNSYPIKIPKTSEANAIFNYLYRLDSLPSKSNFNLLQKNKYKLYQNNILLIEGEILLKGYSGNNYELILFSGIGEFWNSVEKYLYDLSDYNDNFYNFWGHNLIRRFNQVLQSTSPTKNITDFTDFIINGFERHTQYPICYQGEYNEFESNKMECSYTNGLGQEFKDFAVTPDVDFWQKPIESTGRFVGENFTENQACEFRIQYQTPFLMVKYLYYSCVQEYRLTGYNVNLDPAFFTGDNMYWQNIYISTKQVNKTVRGIAETINFTIPTTRQLLTSGQSLENIKFRISDDNTTRRSGNVNIKLNVKTILQVSTANNVQYVRVQGFAGTLGYLLLENSVATDYGNYTGYWSTWNGQDGYCNNVISTYSTFDGRRYFNLLGTTRTAGGPRSSCMAELELNGTFGMNINNNFSISNLTFNFATGPQPVAQIEGSNNGTTWTALTDATFNLLVNGNGILEFTSDDDYVIMLKDMISNTLTIKDFMINFGKLFDLYYHYEPTTKTLNVMTRNTYYGGNNPQFLDLTDRVDKKNNDWFEKCEIISTRPRYLLMKYADNENKFISEYNAKYPNNPYGSMLIDNGNQNNNDTVELWENMIFKLGTVAAERNVKYLWGNPIFNNNQFVLPYFQDKDGKRTDSEMNLFFNFYERNRFFLPSEYKYRYTKDTNFQVANDSRCWLFGKMHDANTDYSMQFTDYPVYKTTLDNIDSAYSLFCGRPRETFNNMDQAINKYNTPVTIYERFWQKYLSDQANVNTKIIKLKILLNKSLIDNDIFRKFIIINDTVWVIQEINGFDITKYEDFADVTLISVNDVSNYSNGQKIVDWH